MYIPFSIGEDVNPTYPSLPIGFFVARLHADTRSNQILYLFDRYTTTLKSTIVECRESQIETVASAAKPKGMQH